jgi:cellulose synthase (UDP-forming)
VPLNAALERPIKQYPRLRRLAVEAKADTLGSQTRMSMRPIRPHERVLRGFIQRLRPATRQRAVWILLGAALPLVVYQVAAIRTATRVGEFALLILILLCEFVMVHSMAERLRALGKTISRTFEADSHGEWWNDHSIPPLVDILIPTYDEDTDVVLRGIAGALAQAYTRRRIWVLDDGNRQDIARLARQCGVNYITRSNREGAKAGNLNNALRQLGRLDIKPDFVAVFDSDHVGLPEFTRRSLSLMHDPLTGLVQTRQTFSNSDHFQRCLAPCGLPSWMSFDYEVLLPSMDANGRAICTGSAFIARYEALSAVGGFACGSLVEDAMTSWRLRSAGWRLKYLNESLSAGLATEGLQEFLIQRDRWATGAAQLARLGLRGATGGILTRLRTAERCLRSFLLPCAGIAVCIAVTLTGSLGPDSMDSGVSRVLTPMAILVLVNGLLTKVISGESFVPMYATAIAVVSFPTTLLASFRGLFRNRPSEFRVTPKGPQNDSDRLHWRAMTWIGTLLAALLVALTARGFRLLSGDPGVIDLVALGAAAYATATFGVALLFCVNHPQRRRAPRHQIAGQTAELYTEQGTVQARLIDISDQGARAALMEPLGLEQGARVTLHVQGLPMALCGTIVRREHSTTYGMSFALSAPLRVRLIQFIYGLDSQRPRRTQEATVVGDSWTPPAAPKVHSGRPLP